MKRPCLITIKETKETIKLTKQVQGRDMAIKNQLNSLLNKKMDRSGFIKHVAVGMVAMSGVGAALKMLAPKPEATNSSALGYGGSAYGGGKSEKVS